MTRYTLLCHVDHEQMTVWIFSQKMSVPKGTMVIGLP